jgi:acetyltransferase-like isoleucine patch superfamily enzyme
MPGAVVLGNVKIGNYVTIGANSTILPGITISNNVIVGAGSVVTRNLLNDQVVIGNPAKFLKKLKKNIIY